MPVTKIVSGGQTGVDRAALDTAIARAIPYGGYCPSGGWSEDYTSPPGLLVDYPLLRETPGRQPAQRTEWNVRDSDATLILVNTQGLACSAGTVFTQEQAQHYCKLCLVIDLGTFDALNQATSWIEAFNGAYVLNVAGPRESEAPGIYASARSFLDELMHLSSAC